MGKKWVEMDADELKKEGKIFKWSAIISLFVCLFSWLFYLYKLILDNVHNSVYALFTIVFLLLAIFEIVIRFHVDTLFVIRTLR